MEIPTLPRRALKRDLWRAIIARDRAHYDGVGIRDGISTVVR
jgi:hypothetical protein